jgi:hypothetical protein
VRRGLAGILLEQGAKAFGRAAGAAVADPRGQEAMARAVGLAQRSLRLFETAQEYALHAAGLAARPDYNELRKQVARLKRKARELSEKLDATAPEEPGAARSEGDGSR